MLLYGSVEIYGFWPYTWLTRHRTKFSNKRCVRLTSQPARTVAARGEAEEWPQPTPGRGQKISYEVMIPQSEGVISASIPLVDLAGTEQPLLRIW